MYHIRNDIEVHSRKKLYFLHKMGRLCSSKKPWLVYNKYWINELCLQNFRLSLPSSAERTFLVLLAKLSFLLGKIGIPYALVEECKFLHLIFKKSTYYFKFILRSLNDKQRYIFSTLSICIQ